jgi:hypothetical protein
LYEKIRMNNVQKQKDASDNKQMRFRKLLASNKFPELNSFLEAELNEDDEKVELDVRTNFAVGGSPFTAQQIAQRKNQSYLDYLARQGVGQSGTTTGPDHAARFGRLAARNWKSRNWRRRRWRNYITKYRHNRWRKYKYRHR